MGDKNLLIEVHVTCPGGREENFTGYPVARGRILTARHGLVPEDQTPGKRIEVRRHHQTGEARAWVLATIEWEDAALDAAVLAWMPPDGREDFGWLSDWHPTDDMRWNGAGIARAGDRGPTASGPFPFQGRVYSTAETETRFHLGIDDACTDPNWYEGASGMPVFVEHRIIGIALTAGGPAGPRRLLASPVRRMLADPEFRKAVGRDGDQERLAAAAERIATALALPRCQGLRGRLARELGGVSDDPRILADALLARDLEPTLEALYTAYSAAGAGDEGVRAVVLEVLGEILPNRYEPGDVAGTAARIDTPGVYCVELPAGLVTAGEIIMAGVRARPVRFHPLTDRDGFPEPLDRLPSPPEAGFDRQGRAYLGNLEADLANKLASPTSACFAADYVPDFESYLGHRFASDEERRVRGDATKRAQMRGIVQDELERQARNRRFFYVLFDAETDPLTGPAAAALQTLKGRYPLLDFAVLTRAEDFEVRRRERRRLSRLRDLLPVKPPSSH